MITNGCKITPPRTMFQVGCDGVLYVTRCIQELLKS